MLYLEDLVVKEKYRSKGIGQLLFDTLKEEAVQKEAILMKWQVLDWNTPAIRFYEKNQATLEGEWMNCKLFIKPS